MHMQTTDFGKKKYAETKRLIRKARQERQLVLFVGAGASVASGMPLWGQAVMQITEKLDLDFKNDEDKLDNLIIPQYYYNARGRKEYTQLMREIFRYDDKLYPRNVHDIIMRFDTDTIITTNYDHLIEQAAENNGEFLYVVGQDSDLPYRKGGKELIKMHGDFEHDNFVLKEDDYLHYHKNFKLIENYVKSLIGTKTVLFIGYSLGDPDVKHIFSWVKEILDEHFQRAYLIITGRKASQNESEYFRHLGVNIIYANELFDENDISFDDHSGQLLQTLTYLLDDEEKQKGIVDSLYDNLKPFAGLKYTYRKYIDKAFNRLRSIINEGITLRVENDNYVVYSEPNALAETRDFLEELGYAIDGKAEDQKVERIAEALRKSVVRGTKRTITEKARVYYECKDFLNKEENPEWIEAINNFDFKRLYELKEFYSKILSENKPELYLQQAYICSFLGDYLSAYYCLDNAVNYFYRRREYAWYFISLWNKKNIAQIIQADFMYNWRIPQDIQESVKNDYDTIDLDKTLQTIPDLGNDNNQFLRDLKDFKFASDLFYDVVSNSMKASLQAKETYYMFAGLPAYEEMRQLIYDYYRYGLYNCLMVDRYRENNEIFNLFVRSIFTSVTTPDKEVSIGSVFGSSGNIHADCLNATDIHLILRYIDAGKLRQLFNEFSINTIEIDQSGRKYFKDLVGNIVPVFNMDLYHGCDIFWRLICFVSHTKIEKDLAETILHFLTDIPQAEYLRNKRDFLIEFVNAIYTQNLYESPEVCRNAKALISTLIDIVSNKTDYLHYYNTTISSFVFFCEAGQVQFDDETAIRKILSEDYYSLLATMYRGCSDNVKAIIKEVFDKWTCPDTGSGYRIYSESVLAGILVPDADIEKRAFDFLIKHNEEKKKELEQGIRTFSLDDLENRLVDLYLSKLLIDADKLKNIVLTGDDEFSKWLVDIDGYDYNEFNLAWLKHCYPSLLEKLAKNKKVREVVVSKFKEKYASDYNDNKINKIVIKYFI